MTGTGEVGDGVLARGASVLHWFLVVALGLVLTCLPGIVVLLLLERDVSNVPLMVLALAPLGPAVAAALYTWRDFDAGRDLSPARHFARGYRLGFLDVLRWWLPALAVLAVLATLLAHLGTPGVPDVLGPAYGVLVLLVLVWSGYAVTVSARFSFRTRDVARLAAYSMVTRPNVSLRVASVVVLAGAAVYVGEWLLWLAGAPLTYLLHASMRPVVASVQERFTTGAGGAAGS